MIEKPKVLKCTLKVLENRSTFEMYLSTSTSTEDFPEMYLSTFQVLYKLYLSTDVLKYKVLMPGSATNKEFYNNDLYYLHAIRRWEHSAGRRSPRSDAGCCEPVDIRQRRLACMLALALAVVLFLNFPF